MTQLSERKSVRVFTEKPVEKEIKTALFYAAIAAPTAGCQQLYTMIDVTDGEEKKRLSELCDNQPFMASAPILLVFCADVGRWYRAYQISGARPRKPGMGDWLLAVDDALIAAQNVVTAAHSFGLGSCYIGDIMENCEKVRELLKLPTYVFPAALLVIGYPTEQQKTRKKPERFALSDIVCENTYREQSEEEIRNMFRERAQAQGFDEYMKAFCNRKYDSDFAAEMTRSVEVYAKDYQSV